jgi:hypothetical protein
MSDFDAEAERKRLREKYEADEENRKRTQQMSELLLKGATMTNRHCGECGSPIFRYEDQEFCPTCQRTMDGEAGEGGADPSAAGAADAAPTGTGDAADAAAAGGATPSEPEEPAADAGTDPESTTPGRGGAEATQATNDPAANGVSAPGSAAGAGRSRDAEPGAAGGSAPETGADATAEATPGCDSAAPTRRVARESLLAALTRHARLAADTDEPRRATDHLEAARTAAAALDELDGS